MNTSHAFIIIIVAALIHASFQLSVSVLTLLGSHAIGAKRSHAKLLRMIAGFVLGVMVMTALVLSSVSLVFANIFQSFVPLLAWAVVCGLLLGLGVAVWSFYYRREKGTTLWLPRGLASYLSNRTKATRQSTEAFGLGLTSVVAELIFIIAPITISGLVLTQLSPTLQLVGIAIYTAVSLLSILVVAGLIGSGHKLSGIQRWREQNKRFLQFSAGSGLLVLGFYVYVDQVVAVAVLGQGGY